MRFSINTKLGMASINMARNWHIDCPLLNIPKNGQIHEGGKGEASVFSLQPTIGHVQVYHRATIFNFSLSTFLP